MTKEDMHRALMHMPWGWLAVSFFLASGWMGFTACMMTLGYEGFNDWRKIDSSYKDVLGICWGVFSGGAIITLLVLSHKLVLP